MNWLINGRVLFLAGQSKALPRLLSGKSQVQLELPSLFFLLGCDDYAHKQEYYAKNCYSYSQDKREFLKKITCQGYGYNSLTQVRYHFTDKLSAFFSNDYHQFNFIIQNKRCQGENRVICAGKTSSLAIALGGGGVVWFT